MKLYIVAGEKSGDKQGALVIQELLGRCSSLSVAGLGGSRMHSLSPDVEDWAEQAGVIGVVDVLKQAGFFLRKLRETEEAIVSMQPDCLLLIDYPGFNQRLLERVRRRCPSLRIVYFIAPMVWAWHRSRAYRLARFLDLMLCTFPFEKPIFEDAHLRTEFVGHPLVDDILANRRTGVREPGLIGLFPGSRRWEIDRHFPVLLEVVKACRALHPERRFITSASSPALAESMERMAREAGVAPEEVNITPGLYHDLMDRAEAALVASGTATLEAALHELPHALIYKTAWGTYFLARLVLTGNIRFIGMVNILADAPVTKELIQQDFNVENCLAELDLLTSPEHKPRILADMAASVARLGHGHAAAKAAEAILALLSEPR